MAKIKVLLAAAKAGGGHIALRNFLYNQLAEDEQSFKLVKFDHPGQMLERSDELIHNVAPMLHELTYFFSPRYISDFFLVATFGFLRKCYQILKQEDPDVVLATHFVLSMHFALAKRLLKSKAIIVNCIPDYGPPAKIMSPKLRPFRGDKIMVFEQWTYDGALKQLGVKKEDLLLAGFNPSKTFSKTAEKYQTKVEARKQLKETFNYFPYTQLDPNKTTVLVTAGAVYARKTVPLLKDIAKEQAEDLGLIDKFQFLVITGSDNKLFERLLKRNRRFRSWSNIFPFPWIDQQLFALIQFASDFPILGSIAPATLNELLETKCGPFIIYKTRPGQELPHRAFVEEKELGEFIPEPKKLIRRLLSGFTEEEKSKFVNNALSFRLEQSSRAAKIPEMVRGLV